MKPYLTFAITLTFSVAIFFAWPGNNQAKAATLAGAAEPKLLLLWTAQDVMLPAGYGGRAIPTPGSTLRISALILPLSLQTPNLEYRWFIDYRLLRRGANLNSISFIPSQTGERTVTLEVRKENEIVAEKSITVPVINPGVAIILEGAGRIASGMEIPWSEKLVFHARPLFFPQRRGETIFLQWLVDGVPVAGEEGNKETLNLNLNKGDVRPLKIELKAQNLNRPDIEMNAGAIINFVNR